MLPFTVGLEHRLLVFARTCVRANFLGNQDLHQYTVFFNFHGFVSCPAPKDVFTDKAKPFKNSVFVPLVNAYCGINYSRYNKKF